jgi:hypothetical protein
VSGELADRKLEEIPWSDLPWYAWKELNPDTKYMELPSE